MRIKLSDYVFRFIASLGIKHVFMLPGGGAMHLVDSLGQNPDIEYVSCLHEQACAIAAEAYARVTNNLGVALVTTGPGGTNAITGVAGAWLDSTPCLFISGQVKRADMIGNRNVRQMGSQEIDIVSIVKPITKYAVTVMDPNDIGYHLEKAVSIAKSGRPGPVWIDIPLDVQAAVIDTEFLRQHKFFKPQREHWILEERIAKALSLLIVAKRPVILAGNGIRLANAQDEFLELAEQLRIPVLTSRLGLDLIPYDHELFAGRPGALAPRGANFVLQNSDWLLSVGARLDLGAVGYSYENFARGAKKVIVDIDQAELLKIGTPIAVPICADAKDFIAEFYRQSGFISIPNWADWIAKCQEWKEKYPVVLPEHREPKEQVSIYAFSEALSDELTGDDVIIPGSSGNATEIFDMVLKVKAGQRVFHARGLGAMGFGLPASIGACLASGKKRTISVDGDGGFQLNIQELETLARLRLPIKIFVINNGGYASIRASQQRYFGRLVGADAKSGLTLPDTIRLTCAYYLTAACIHDPEDLRLQIRRILNLPGPVICDVKVIPDEERRPHLASVQNPDGSMESRPLEDLWPFLERAELAENMNVGEVRNET